MAIYAQDYARRWIAQRDGSRGYGEQMLWAIVGLEKWAGRKLRVEQLSAGMVADYIMARKDQVAPVTRRNERNLLWRLLHAAAKDRAIDKRPRINAERPIVRVGQVLAEAWSIEEVRELLRAAETLPGRYENGPVAAEFWAAWIRVAWDTGLRGCDLRRMRREWVQANGRFALVQQKSRRPVYGALRPEALDAWKKLSGPQPLAWWCGVPCWRRCAARLVRRAKLRGTIGWLRRSAATACEIAHPGQGYVFLGNTPGVFYEHYFDRSQAPVIQPPEL